MSLFTARPDVPRFKIHQPLFAGFLIVIGLVVALVVVLVATGLRNELVSQYESQLERELNLAAAILAEDSGTAPDVLVGRIAEAVQYRVTLVGPGGELLGDSEVSEGDLTDVENHAERPEVVAALSGAVGFAERQSATVGTRLLYGARSARLGESDVVIRIAAPLDDIDQAVRRGQRAVAVAGIFGMLLALVVAYLASRLLARPLVVLAERAGALAAGDFDQRAPLNTPVAELGDLYAAFNRLSDELQVRLSELGHERDEMEALIDCMAEGVVALTEDARVIRINRAARSLLRVANPPALAPVGSLINHAPLLEIFESSVAEGVEAKEVPLRDRMLMVSTRPLDQGGSVVTFLDVTESRKLERIRQDFVANASHELKTPLTTMRGFTETLIEDDPPEDLRKEFLGMIHASSLRLQHVVDDLLDLSRLESGVWQAHLEAVDVGSAADAVWATMHQKAVEKDVRYMVEGYGSVRADPSGLTQIFQNLFDNALRYVDTGGTVRIRITRDGTVVTVEVEDDGAGIPAVDLPRVFERFYRVDAARSRAEGGTGLGLAIVRHLVTAMDGTVIAESAPGSGTLIRITLPSAR